MPFCHCLVSPSFKHTSFQKAAGNLSGCVCDGQHAGTELIWKSGLISKSGFAISNSIDEGQDVGEGVRSLFAEHAN